MGGPAGTGSAITSWDNNNQSHNSEHHTNLPRMYTFVEVWTTHIESFAYAHDVVLLLRHLPAGIQRRLPRERATASRHDSESENM